MWERQTSLNKYDSNVPRPQRVLATERLDGIPQMRVTDEGGRCFRYGDIRFRYIYGILLFRHFRKNYFLSWLLLLLLLFLNDCFVLVFGTVHCSLLYRSMVHSVLLASTFHRKKNTGNCVVATSVTLQFRIFYRPILISDITPINNNAPNKRKVPCDWLDRPTQFDIIKTSNRLIVIYQNTQPKCIHPEITRGQIFYQ